MATFHEMTDPGAPPSCGATSGAPDVLISRGGPYRNPDGTLAPVTDDNQHLAMDANDRMAESGERVMVVAEKVFDPSEFEAVGPGAVT